MSHSFNITFLATCVMFCVIVAANAIDFAKRCEEGEQWKDKCHTCHCSNGRPVCTRELCEGEGSSAVLPTPLAGETTPKPKPNSGLSLHSSFSWYATALAITIALFTRQ